MGRNMANYCDDDIIIIDSIKDLDTPRFARVDMNAVLVCTAGRAQFDLNGEATVLERNQLLLTPVNTTFSNFMFSPGFEFIILLMTNRILQSFLREKMSIWNEVLYVHKMHVLTLDDEQDMDYFTRFYGLLKLNYESQRHTMFRTEVMQAILRSGMLGLCGILKERIAEAPAAPAATQTHHLFQQFLDCLSSQHVKHRPVRDYASELCVTPKYLSAVCKRHSGKTANQWITEQVLEDIRFHLAETGLSVKEISNELGFANASFFGKFVSTHFGTSPAKLRQQLRHVE